MRKKLGRSTDLVKPGSPPTPEGTLIFERAFASSEHHKSVALEELLKLLTDRGVLSDSTEAINVRLALDEALVNAVTHGNHSNVNLKARIRAYLSPTRMSFIIEDEGAGFREEDLPDPDAPENLLEENGRGVILIRGIMSEVSYWRGGTTLLMSKALHSPGSDSSAVN